MDEGFSGADEGREIVNEAALEPFLLVRAGITALRQLPAYGRSNAEARAALTRALELKAGVEALVHGLVADLDTRPDAIPGARPDHVARTYLRRFLRRTPGQAEHEVECARQLAADADPLAGGLPLVAQALAAGRISQEHADVAVRAVTQLSAEELAQPRARSLFDGLLRPSETPPDPSGPDDGTVPTGYALDAVLAAQARLLDSHQLQILARRIVAAIKDDDRDGFDPDAVERRYLTHAQDPETGMTIGKFQLDAENGAWFEAAMEQFARRDEPRDETTQDGEGSITTPVRTPGQVAADALGEI